MSKTVSIRRTPGSHSRRSGYFGRSAAGAVAVGIGSVWLTLAGHAHAEPGGVTQAQVVEEYVDAFKPYAMVPVLVPIGQEVGDVLDKLGEEFIHRSGECFRPLRVHEEPSRLPNLDLGTAAAARLGLGLSNLADADLHALGTNRVIVRFDKVTMQTVSQGEFREAVNAQACPELARLINKDPEALKENTFLVGTVFRARSTVRIDRERKAGGGVGTSWLTTFAARFGLKLRAEAGGDVDSAQTVELSTTDPTPVALRPAFIRVDPGQPGFRGVNKGVVVEFKVEDEEDRKALVGWLDRQLAQAARDRSNAAGPGK